MWEAQTRQSINVSGEKEGLEVEMMERVGAIC